MWNIAIIRTPCFLLKMLCFWIFLQLLIIGSELKMFPWYRVDDKTDTFFMKHLMLSRQRLSSNEIWSKMTLTSYPFLQTICCPGPVDISHLKVFIDQAYFIILEKKFKFRSNYIVSSFAQFYPLLLLLCLVVLTSFNLFYYSFRDTKMFFLFPFPTKTSLNLINFTFIILRHVSAIKNRISFFDV